LFQYLKENEPSQTPPNWWWVVIASINVLTVQVNIIFTKLQGKELVSQQSTELVNLASLICIQVSVDGPHSSEEVNALNNTINFMFSRWSISHHNVIRYLFNQGMFV